LVKEVEQLMNDKSLNNLKSLWEKLENQKTNNEENQNSLVHDLLPRYKQDSIVWIPPNFASLPTQDYTSKISSKPFSMVYNEELKNNSVSNVSKMYLYIYLLI